MVGVNTLLEALQRRADTNQVTFTTETLAGGATHDLTLEEGGDNIDSITFDPDDTAIGVEGLLLMVRPIVVSGSTDTDFLIHEDDDRQSIDEVLRINELSVNDSPQTFQPGGGNGVQFLNQNGDEELYLRFIENSSLDSVYQIRMRWFDVR